MNTMSITQNQVGVFTTARLLARLLPQGSRIKRQGSVLSVLTMYYLPAAASTTSSTFKIVCARVQGFLPASSAVSLKDMMVNGKVLRLNRLPAVVEAGQVSWNHERPVRLHVSRWKAVTETWSYQGPVVPDFELLRSAVMDDGSGGDSFTAFTIARLTVAGHARAACGCPLPFDSVRPSACV
jgi:hypothetical protein